MTSSFGSLRKILGMETSRSPLWRGPYLQWIDFRRLEPDAEKLRQKMLYQAHVAMDEGSMFGPEGNGFERLNLAAPRNLIEEIMVASPQYYGKRTPILNYWRSKQE